MASRNLAHIVMISLLCGITLAVGPSADPAGNKDDQAVQAALDHELPTVQLNQIPLSKAFDFLHDELHVNFVVNWKALEKNGVEKATPVSANLHHVRLSGLLKVILDQAGGGKLGYVVNHGVIKISTRDDFRGAADTTRPAPTDKEAKAIQKALNDEVPSVAFDKVGLSDAIDFLRDVTGTNLVVDWEGVKSRGFDESTPVTIHLRAVKFSKVLQVTLDEASNGELDYSIDQNIITISGKFRDGSDKPTTRPAPGKEDKDALAALDRKLPSVEFNQISLADTLDFLRDVTGTNVVVNWKSIEATGINRDTTVTLSLKDAKFSTILQTVLDQVEDGKLEFFVDEGIITIQAKKQIPPEK